MTSIRIAALCAASLISAGVFALPAFADDSGFASSHALRREKGKLCMSEHDHLGTADGKTKPAAKAAAVRTWEKFTNLEYGSDWARYSRAAPVSTEYTKAEKGWTVVVVARPCK